jgi:hypothetical protein
MQTQKKMRHPWTAKSAAARKAARVRWDRAALANEAGSTDQPQILHDDARLPIDLDLTSAGWLRVRLEPRRGYVGWRIVDDASGAVLHCAAIKEAMRWIAAQVPRQLGRRNLS